MLVIAVILLLFSKSHALSFTASNSSRIPPFLNPNPDASSEPPPLSSNPLLNRILSAIADKERWDPNAGIRVSEFDPTRVQVGRSQRYRFHVRVGRRAVLMMELPDEVEEWKNLGGSWARLGPDLEFEDPKPAVGGLELEGPLDLSAVGEDDELSLLLPTMNVAHKGLRRVLIGDGIKIKLEGAQELALIHPHDISIPPNKRSVKHNLFPPLTPPSCTSLPSVRVVGSASVTTSRTYNFKTKFLSDDTIQLLPQKCYNNIQFKQFLFWSFEPLSSKVRLLDKVLSYVLGKSIIRGIPVRVLKAKISASNLAKLRVQVEREITENDRIWKAAEAWKTKPAVERIWFEIVVAFGGGKRWEQVVVRKLTRPVKSVESSPWSNLMSNISFTQFSSVVFPPDGFSLDVEW